MILLLTNVNLLISRIEGGDLQTLLDQEEFLEEAACIDIMKDTLKGLQFLHKQTIAHLDIKVRAK